MNKLLNWFKKFSPERKNETAKEFEFFMYETQNIGDWYRYTVEANSKEEAFEKLVKYFFAEGEDMIQPVKQESGNVTIPNGRFYYEGMPYWFAKRVSGVIKEFNNNYQMKLEEYANAHGIKLSNKY